MIFTKIFTALNLILCFLISYPAFSDNKTEWTRAEQKILNLLFPDGKVTLVESAHEDSAAVVTHNLTSSIQDFLKGIQKAQNPWKSQIIKTIKIKDDDYLVLTETHNTTDHYGHPVGGLVGYSIFKIEPNKTIQKIEDLRYFDELGSFGRYGHGEEDIYPISLGPDQWGVVLVSGYTSHGETDLVFNFYQFDQENKKLFLILRIGGLAESECVGEIPYSTTRLNVYPNFQNQKNNYYALELHVQKIMNASDEVAFPRAILGFEEDTFVLEFDGVKYTHKIPKEQLKKYHLNIDVKNIDVNR